MNEGGKEENLSVAVDFVDIKDGNEYFHWINRKKLSEVLSKGLVSPRFADRAGFSVTGSNGPTSERMVYFTNNAEEIWGMPSEGITIMADLSETDIRNVLPQTHSVHFENLKWFTVPFRVAPRQIRALVILDKKPPDLNSEFDPNLEDFEDKIKAKKLVETAVKMQEKCA